ncbi:MAG: helix-turn-helix domain-containing protein [Draconibacterium sp.]|nr:helix-turn-helix domain-containing protein [Draconibacterium sp.]
MLITVENTIKKPSTQEPQKNINYDLLDKLKYALETEKRYLDANLTISLLAKELHTNREYLSRTINHYFGKNYTDLLNEYRVKSAIHLFEDITNGTVNNCTMLQVAHTSGFKSTSTFNPAFKKMMGVTPSGFKKRVKAGNAKVQN